MNALLENFHIIVPEVILLITALVTLVVDLFLPRRESSFPFFSGMIGLLLAAVASYFLLGEFKSLTLGGLFVSDDVAQLMKLFMCVSVGLCFIYSQNYIRERNIPSREYYSLSLFSLLGMMILVSAHSLLTIYLGLELLSLPLYALTAIQRTNGEATESAMKYFVMGSIASGMLLYGLSLLYGATGKLDLLDLANVVAVSWQEQDTLLLFALAFIVVGIGFKLAAFPFHNWAPDVYQGAPTSVVLLISSAPKIAAMGMAFRLLTQGLGDLVGQWQHLLIAIALLSAGIGNLVAIVQNNLKRLFAYSAVSHAGYALFGVIAATANGYAAALYYVLVYSLMSLAAFGLLVLLSNKGIEIESIDSLKGLSKRNPWLAFMMLIVMFSMAGVPPTVGFFTKLMVLKALIDSQLTWVAVFGLIFAVMGAYYYVRIVKVMYFEEPLESVKIEVARPLQFVYSINCMLLVYWGIFPSALIAACINAFH